ncbi:PQQ-binding-like beta-propeller repeat protein [Dactylosporangium aurantiacum]|uniref:PQQ-binding-like beta-propeller repeat protein n=1 Tax=Dactylosporangium aurantiacum TaxID=35754 RepID=A0A9Q9MDH9_9ACTN|nr:PQQ-binding-like beta-propeller repeat protein [Dactylosporangium aurantiacum]MDG6103361.1 PQQ-binding-like beta-propeller repeat protein [Dactylosporangium aurantiacum]UWZ52119.1 PQQ-binding-like beta-propeller repeat protein [Dactylosporangium aurantiacum]
MIDLDTAPAPAPHRPPRRRAPWWAVPLVLAAVVPATAPPPAPMAPVTGLPPGTMRLAGAGDAFYVLRGNGTLAWNVTAYDWTGAERWRRPLPGPDPDLMIAPGGGAVLVVRQPCDRQHPPSVDRLDPATGRTLWTAPGAVHAVTAAGDLLLAEGPGCGARRRVTALTLANAADGAARWTVRFPDGRTVAAGPDWFVATGGDGRFDTYALTGGARLGGGTVPATSVVLAAGGSVIAADRPDPARPGRLTGQPAAAPAPAWSVPFDGAAAACGPWLCVTSGAVTTALDPATGRPRWTAPALRDPVTGPSYAVAAGVRIVRWRDGSPAALPGWRLLPPAEGSAGPVLQRGTAIGVVDLTLGRLDVLGTLPGPQARCLAGGHRTGPGLRLVCLDAAGGTRLWRRP